MEESREASQNTFEVLEYLPTLIKNLLLKLEPNESLLMIIFHNEQHLQGISLSTNKKVKFVKKFSRHARHHPRSF